MAHIRKLGDKWRVEVFLHGQRSSKVVESEDDAQLWADHEAARLGAQTIRYKPRMLVRNGPELVTMVPKTVLAACREIPHNHLDILEAAVPTSMPSGIYFLIRDGEITYVGQSGDVLNRIARHRREGKTFDAYSYMECERDDLDRLESMYIRALVPEGNLSFGNHREQKSRPGTKRFSLPS